VSRSASRSCLRWSRLVAQNRRKTLGCVMILSMHACMLLPALFPSLLETRAMTRQRRRIPIGFFFCADSIPHSSVSYRFSLSASVHPHPYAI
jgi:hypothetical protein